MLISVPEYAGGLPGSFKRVGWINASPRGAVLAHDSLRTVLGYAKATIVDAACANIPVTGAMLGQDGLLASAGPSFKGR